MHDYDDEWKCKCGYRLVAELDAKTGRLNVKACVTPEGEKIPFGENALWSEKQKGHAKRTKRADRA